MHNGRLGVFYLKEAALDVMLEAGESIGPAEISRRAGIPGDRDPNGIQLTQACQRPSETRQKRSRNRN